MKSDHYAVIEKEHRSPASRLGRAAMGERLGGFIYGTIVVLAVLVAGAKAYPHAAGRIAALVAITSVVFWLAHVYAHSLGQSVATDEHLSMAELRHIARREGSIVEAAVPPLGALMLGAFGLVSTRAAVWLAFGLGLAVLAVAGSRLRPRRAPGLARDARGRHREPRPRCPAGRLEATRQPLTDGGSSLAELPRSSRWIVRPGMPT